MTNPKWLEWAQRLQALAQSGLTYTTNPFDVDRYEAVRQVAAEMISDHTRVEMPIIREIIDAQAGYATPKLDVRGAVFRDGKILMVRELADGFWTLPGGFVDVNDSPAAAVERELLEETGYTVKARKLAAVYDRNLHEHPPYLFSVYKLFFLCDLLGGSPVNSHETADAGFFPEDELPPLSLTRITPDEISHMFEHYRAPDLPTEFD